jgi:hypothetical protein
VKPYHEEKGITIYHGDCREILPTLSGIGLILADPPYGIDFATNFTRLPGGGQDHPRVFDDDKPFDPTHLLGISRYLILWGAQNYARHLPPSNTWIVWDKRYGMDSDAFLGDAELAWTNLTGGGIAVPPPVGFQPIARIGRPLARHAKAGWRHALVHRARGLDYIRQ